MRTCPLLDEDGKVRIHFLWETPIAYVIEEVPAEPIVKRYVDGSSIRQVLFMLSSNFYEKLSDWFEQQTLKGSLPNLPQGMESQKIEAISTGYALKADEPKKIARYQIQCKLTYYKER